MFEPCSPGCPGWFRNSETLRIERCDECARFDDDTGAEDYVRANDLGEESREGLPGDLDHCLDCGGLFYESGSASRSASDTELCSYCYTNGA